MLTPDKFNYIDMSALEQPYLVVVIDTEEDFDWSQDFDRKNTNVHSMEFIKRGQQVFDDFNIKPVYVVDYPIVSQPQGHEVLKELLDDNRCDIGVHLHPWVTPPFEENITRENSFTGNLPLQLEKEKIKQTAELINTVFGKRPVIYKAGRYGVGKNTANILEDLNFEIDLSICPYMDFSYEKGPNFTDYNATPFWFGEKNKLLELPLTNGFTGLLRRRGMSLYNYLSKSIALKLHAPGIAAKSRLLNKLCLSPEGFSCSELIELVTTLYKDGLRIFSFALHSPSLTPGNTPYVCSNKELQQFLKRCTEFFDFFINKLEGKTVTPSALRAQLL